MSAVVITGAAGDLGRSLSASFLDDGHTVFGADIAPIELQEGLIRSSSTSPIERRRSRSPSALRPAA
jgi:nucleoside-diphosphate-sugar epimerase